MAAWFTRECVVMRETVGAVMAVTKPKKTITISSSITVKPDAARALMLAPCSTKAAPGTPARAWGRDKDAQTCPVGVYPGSWAVSARRLRPRGFAPRRHRRFALDGDLRMVGRQKTSLSASAGREMR